MQRTSGLYVILQKDGKPNVSICLCCGQYFIPKTRKVTSYCDRIIRDGKTCKKIAPSIIHKIAVDTDPVLKAFERTKQKTPTDIKAEK